jgi:hypothetical protein
VTLGERSFPESLETGSTFRSPSFQVQFHHLRQPHRSTQPRKHLYKREAAAVVCRLAAAVSTTVERVLGPTDIHVTSPECLPIRNKQFRVTIASDCRSQWPRGLRHEPSSPARTLESWVRIQFEAWMSVCVYSVFVLFCM